MRRRARVRRKKKTSVRPTSKLEFSPKFTTLGDCFGSKTLLAVLRVLNSSSSSSSYFSFRNLVRKIKRIPRSIFPRPPSFLPAHLQYEYFQNAYLFFRSPPPLHPPKMAYKVRQLALRVKSVFVEIDLYRSFILPETNLK